jgi:tetratricopeptide (TPR) repeat protein
LAAAVVDLLLADSPEIARSSAYDLRWARIYFDAGRSAAALPFLERMDADATRRVDRERARWWLHEAALVHRDSLTARKWLRRILEGTPGSTLVPLVRIRLEVLDAIEAEGAGKDLSWQEVALDLRTHALQWPHTPIEDEALSLTAQLFVELGLVEDALSLYRWIEERTPSVGGAIAYEHLVCRAAPQAFHELRGRGELIRALGIYRGFLDEPVMHGCVDVATRSDAASTAMTAGLPTLAARWLGQAVAEGTGGLDETRNLLALAEMYLVEGKIDAAAQTLDYLEGAALPEPSGLVDAAWGDVHLAQGEWAEAVTAFDAALEQVEGSVRTRGRAASLHYRRGLALDRLGRHDEAIAELRVGLDGGGADDPATGWLRLASALSRGGGDAATWEAILVSCDQAEAAGSDEQTLRALSWYRSQAMLGLGRAEEAKVLLDELATGPDTWALMARESMASTAFDASLEAILGAPSEP